MSTNLPKGYTKEQTIALQIKLNKALANVSGFKPLDPDGAFGKMSVDALKLFQQFAGIKDDGLYGPATEKILNTYLNKGYTPNMAIDQLINKAKEKGVTSRNELAMLVSQMYHESLGFMRLEEDLNYRAETLVAKFSKYVPNLETAKQIVAQGPQAIANAIYGTRMGNTKGPNYGYLYRGSAWIQLTGYDNFLFYGKFIGLDIANNPDLARKYENAADVSLSYWFGRGGLRQAAQAGDVTKATQLINGGTNGAAERKALYDDWLLKIKV